MKNYPEYERIQELGSRKVEKCFKRLRTATADDKGFRLDVVWPGLALAEIGQSLLFFILCWYKAI